MSDFQKCVSIFSILGIVCLVIVIGYYILQKLEYSKYANKYNIKRLAIDIANELSDAFFFILIILLVACIVISALQLNNTIRDNSIEKSNRRYDALTESKVSLDTNPFFLPHGTYCYSVDMFTTDDILVDDYVSLPAQIRVDEHGVFIEKIFLPEGDILIDEWPNEVEQFEDDAIISYGGRDVGLTYFTDQDDVEWEVTLSSIHKSHSAVKETVIHYETDVKDTSRNHPSIIYTCVSGGCSILSFLILCICKTFYKESKN